MFTWLKTAAKIIKGTAKKFKEDDPVVYAAAIAFFTIFSLPPILFIVIIIAGSVLKEEVVRGEVSSQIEGLIGRDSAIAVEKILENASQSDQGLMATIIGFATLIFSATVVFSFIQKALNAIWHVKPKPKKGLIKFIEDRLVSFSLIVTLGFLMLVSLIIDAGLQIFKNYISFILENTSLGLMAIINFIITLGVITVIFALIFKFLPDAKIRWKDVWVGALVTATLFNIGKMVIGLILGNTDIASAYGAAGSIVAIFLWVFYSTIILLIGAEFTQQYTQHKGEVIRPKKHAVAVEKREIEKEV